MLRPSSTVRAPFSLGRECAAALPVLTALTAVLTAAVLQGLVSLDALSLPSMYCLHRWLRLLLLLRSSPAYTTASYTAKSLSYLLPPFPPAEASALDTLATTATDGNSRRQVRHSPLPTYATHARFCSLHQR